MDMLSPDSAPGTASSSRGFKLREGYDLYGAQVRNRVIVGLVALGLAFWTWTLQARFAHGTSAHVALIWTTAVLFGVAELSWSWARLLWRSWMRGRRFTRTRLWYEAGMAVLVALAFGLYVLLWLKW
jgi:small-conductance mechanosensitive channel